MSDDEGVLDEEMEDDGESDKKVRYDRFNEYLITLIFFVQHCQVSFKSLSKKKKRLMFCPDGTDCVSKITVHQLCLNFLYLLTQITGKYSS